MNVLLGIDFSTSSDEVIDEVLDRPWPPGARFCLLHVVDESASILRRAGGRSMIEDQYRASELLVGSASERLAKRGLKVTTHVSNGHPASRIVDYATEWNADFLIVGSHGHSRMKRFLVGSAALAAVRHAACSVEIVRARAPRLPGNGASMRILLATDGSENSMAAARSVARRPWPPESKFRVISVVHVEDPAYSPWKGAAEDIARIEGDILSQGEYDVSVSQRLLEGAGLKTSGSVLRGYPKAMIVDEATAWRADLIVVGSHGRRGIARLLMGSVSESVAVHALCSVEVIRERAVRESR